MKQKIVLIDTGLTIVAILLLAGLAMACTGCQVTTAEYGGAKLRSQTPMFMQNNFKATYRATNGVEITIDRSVATQTQAMSDAFAAGAAIAVKAVAK